jgi:ABC-type Fe3+-hydroxamate transport system, periplasmic component
MKLSKHTVSAGLMALMMVLLAACGNSNNSNEASAPATSTPSSSATRVLTDAMGHQVEVPAHPQRIIAPFLEDPLSAMGVSPVAQWSAGGQPQQYLQDKLSGVPSLNMDNGLTAEETLSYKPDLILFLSPSYMGKIDYDQFSKIAPTFVLSEDNTDWRTNLEKLGDLLGEQDAAKKALEQYEEKMEAAKSHLGDLPSEKTAVILLPQDDKSFKLFGPNFYGGKTLYQTLGFKQPAALKGDFEAYSMETLADLKDVDYIFVISGPGRSEPPEDNALWKSLKAVRESTVFKVDSGHWFNDNPVANGLIADDVLNHVHE